MKPILLCILDGVGIRNEEHGNAVKMAKMPTFDMLWNTYPHCLLDASEESVGLPKGQMGNSEVGHSNIGAGRIIYQPQQLINEEIKNKNFFENKNIKEVIEHTNKNNSKLHILGLLSDGGIHSHIDHLMNLIDMAKNNGVKQIYFHVFLDGRDTKQDEALIFLRQLENKIKETGFGIISTISGRFYAMDRDNRWERVEKAYNAIVDGVGRKIENYEEEIKNNYENKIYDEFIEPMIIDSNGLIESNDGLIVFNYRPDRLRELFSAITNPKFKEFSVKDLDNIKLVTMFPVSEEVICTNAYQKQNLKNTLGTYLSEKGITQLRIAETEKYAHVTYFFDGGKELQLKGKEQILIPSPKVTTYDLKPEMSAYEITDKLLEEIDNDKHQFIVLNFANGDMVGHTGNLKSTIKSLEDLDKCLGRIFDKIKSKKGTLIVTADHGNSDYMLDENNQIITSHSMSKVPLIVTNSKYKLRDGKLADIAPTILKIMNLKKPKEMTGESLIKNKKSKICNIFIIFSFVFFAIFISTYTCRFIHYYNLENNPNNVVIDNKITTRLKETIVTSGNGLYYTNDNEYIYKGDVNNNYLYYSGYMFRIVKINKDGTIKLITDNSVTNLAYNIENNYKTSYIRNYLNDNGLEHTGIFYNSLNNRDQFLIPSSFCVDSISLDNVTCKETVNDYVGLLTYQEYMDALANESYLNNNTYWWLSNSSDKDIWYVFNNGGVNDSGISKNNIYGVRPVITLREDVEIISGNGTLEDPYKIENDIDLTVGKYINYSNYTWKIIDIEEDRIKLALNSYISDKQLKYSSKNNIYNLNDKTSIAYYLNNNFYNTLEKEYLVKGIWYIGEYNEDKNYDYKNLYTETVNAYVGMLKVDDLFVNDLDEYYLLTPSIVDHTYSVKNNIVIKTLMEDKNNIRPSVFVSRNINLTGTGTLADPYVVKE